MKLDANLRDYDRSVVRLDHRCELDSGPARDIGRPDRRVALRLAQVGRAIGSSRLESRL